MVKQLLSSIEHNQLSDYDTKLAKGSTMTKLFTLTGLIDYEGERFLGNFSTKEKAIEHIQNHSIKAMCYDGYMVRSSFIDMPSTAIIEERISI